MPQQHRVPPGQSTMALILGGCVLALSLFARHRAPAAVTLGQGGGATEAPSPPAPIADSAEAVRRSLALFPPGHSPHGEVARLVSRITFEVWDGNGVPGSLAAPNPELFDWSDADPQSPVWLVGVLGTELSVDDVLAVEAPPGAELTDKRAAIGAYYAWDANSAELLTQGALVLGAAQTYEGLTAMANAPLTPRAATPWPTLALSTPGPTETWSPSELATGIAQLTAAPRGTP